MKFTGKATLSIGGKVVGEVVSFNVTSPSLADCIEHQLPRWINTGRRRIAELLAQAQSEFENRLEELFP